MCVSNCPVLASPLLDAICGLRSRKSILRNSPLNAGFIPAYINGLIVLDKYRKNMQRSETFRGIFATRWKRRKTTITQNGIQQIMNANTTTNRDLLSLISFALMKLFPARLRIVDDTSRLCCRIIFATFM